MSASEKANSTSAKQATSGSADAWRGKHLGRFQLLDLLGRGAMGSVFLAFDTTLKRNVALKVLPKKQKTKERTYRQEQFLREARSAARLEHPNVVRVYEVGQASGYHFIAMELVTGGTVQQHIREDGPAPRVQACLWGSQAAEALHFGHVRGVVHRDVKPSNLMLNEDMEAKLGDFGLAHLEDPDDPFRLKSETVGTPYYMSPEVIEGTPATPKSDIYSLACTLWYIFCGKPPFKAKTPEDVFELHKTAPIPDIKKLRPDLPTGVVNALYRALQKDPEQRFDTAEEFANILRAHSLSGTGQIAAAELKHAHKIPMARGNAVGSPGDDSGSKVIGNESVAGDVVPIDENGNEIEPPPSSVGRPESPAGQSASTHGDTTVGSRLDPSDSRSGSRVAGKSYGGKSAGLTRHSLATKSGRRASKNQPWLVWALLLAGALLLVLIPLTLFTLFYIFSNSEPELPPVTPPGEDPLAGLVEPEQVTWQHLIRKIDVDSAALVGSWTRRNSDELVAEGKGDTRLLRLPIDPAEVFEVRLAWAIRRIQDGYNTGLIVPLDDGAVRIVFNADFTGLGVVSGKPLHDGNPSKSEKIDWPSGRKHTIRVRVDRRDDRLAVTVFRDGESDPAYHYVTTQEALSLRKDAGGGVSEQQAKGLFGLICWGPDDIRFEILDYRELAPDEVALPNITADPVVNP